MIEWGDDAFNAIAFLVKGYKFPINKGDMVEAGRLRNKLNLTIQRPI